MRGCAAATASAAASCSSWRSYSPRHRARARDRRVHGAADAAHDVHHVRPPVTLARRELLPLHEQHAPARRRAVGDEPPAAAAREDLAVAAAGDGRDRGRALLAARRARLPGHCARLLPGPLEGPHRAGRLDDHPGARPQPLHRQPAADAVAQGQRGLPRGEVLPRSTAAEADPRRLPQRGLLRAARVRRAGRRADVLLEERLGADARAGSAARRPAAGADRRTTRSSTRSAALARRNEVLQAMWKNGYITAAKLRTRAAEERSSCRPGPSLHAAAPAELLRLGDAAARAAALRPAAGRAAAGSG